MSLEALVAWAKKRGLDVEVEEVTRLGGFVHLRLWAELDGEHLFKERAVPDAREAATLDELAAEWLDDLRGGRR